MTKEALIAFIETNVRNSSVDAFTNLRLNSILLNLAMSGITDTFTSYADFEAQILTNREEGRDWYMRVRDVQTGYIYEYFPNGDGTGVINWTASQKFKNY